MYLRWIASPLWNVTLLVIFFVTLLGASLTGCRNGGNSTESETNATPSETASLPNGNTVLALTLNKVVRSNQDPNSMIELIGSGGEIGTLCPSKTDCQCQFDWIESNGSKRQAFQTPERVEVNMMRCLFTQVSSTSAAYYDVRVFKTTGITSNPVRVYMTSANPSLNPSIAANYSQVQRYQCRDFVEQNTNFYGQNLLDPELWDKSQAYNFFTTSLGLDYGAQGARGYECPPVPNDASNSSAYDINLYSLEPIDINNPLLTDVSTGDITIYPSTDNLEASTSTCPTGKELTCEQFRINRHDFYLANFMDGTFKVPFCAIHKVSNIAGTTATLNCGPPDASKGTVVLGSAALTGTDIIGFAAVPDANQKCPDSSLVKIPAGKKWAKVWRFRTSITPRVIQDVANPADIGFLFCTNRVNECSGFDGAGTWDSVCHHLNASNSKSGTNSGFTPQRQTKLLPGGIGFGNCSSNGTQGDGYIDGSTYTNAGAACDNCCLDQNNGNGAANFTVGGDYCNGALPGAQRATDLGGFASDNWLFGSGANRACIEADTDANGKPTFSPLPDPAGTYVLSSKLLDSQPKSDVVYVITPESVTIETMQDPTNPVARQYIPYRYIAPGGPKQVYGLELGSSNSSDPAQRLSQFPLCVLQDAK